jgi:hypothetical protein
MTSKLTTNQTVNHLNEQERKCALDLVFYGSSFILNDKPLTATEVMESMNRFRQEQQAKHFMQDDTSGFIAKLCDSMEEILRVK